MTLYYNDTQDLIEVPHCFEESPGDVLVFRAVRQQPLSQTHWRGECVCSSARVAGAGAKAERRHEAHHEQVASNHGKRARQHRLG